MNKKQQKQTKQNKQTKSSKTKVQTNSLNVPRFICNGYCVDIYNIMKAYLIKSCFHI